jgi:hypothetical protein
MVRAIAPNDDVDNCGLSYSELQELWLGPCNGGSVFADAEQLRAAWDCTCMKLWGAHGRRPQAWWFLGDAASLGLQWPGRDRERSYLYAAGALSEQERSELEREWRQAFDLTRSGSESDSKRVTKAERRAQREAFEHADIPHELITAWAATQRRRRRQPAPSAGLEEAAAIK